MKILLIEDNSLSASTVRLMLKSAGYPIEIANCGHEGMNMARHYDFNVILLDLMLPDISGHDVINAMRNSGINTPVIVLTANSSNEIKNQLLRQYADDYLIKPYNQEELEARIQAVIRRSNGHSNSKIKIGNVVVDTSTHSVYVNNKTINLTDKEYRIISLLATRKGITLSKETFLTHIYSGIEEPELKIIDVFICKLRKKISSMNNGVNYIQTVWGRGYVMKDTLDSECVDDSMDINQVGSLLNNNNNTNMSTKSSLSDSETAYDNIAMT